MNKNFLPLVAAGLFLCGNPLALAQTVSFPEGDAAWTVAITPQAPATAPETGASKTGAAQPRPTKIDVTQLGKLKRIIITWSDGKTTEKWTIPGLPVTFVEDPRSGLVRPRQNGGPADLMTNLSQTYDAAAFAWATPDCLQEKDPVSYQGKQCFHYVGSVVVPLSDMKQKASRPREAWIDAKTLLPVTLKTDDAMSIFTFQDKPPEGPLTPPPAFQKEIAYYKAVMGYP